ncbi:MAG: cysteine--tRNA ligase, partial [Actinomycetota bacterium]
ALAAVLELEDAIHAWSADTVQGDHVDRARATLRAMLVELASAAVSGLRDERDVVGPVVEIALDARRRARDARDFSASDAIRDGLAAHGIEVRDTPDGQEWDLRED